MRFSRLLSGLTLLIIAACSGGTGEGGDILPVDDDGSSSGFVIGGTVEGLSGTGLVLWNNGGDDLEIGAGGAFVFATPLADGELYEVTVAVQPADPAQLCTVANGSGTVAGGDVTDIEVACLDGYGVGVVVSGLTGTGLVLRNNGGDDLTVNLPGDFTFATSVADGGSYSAAVTIQPASPSQLCEVSGGVGTVAGGNVTNIVVTCTSAFRVGGRVTGLAGSGLLVQLNGGEQAAITANGAYGFPTPLAAGDSYSVAVISQPGALNQVCTMTGASGTDPGSEVTTADVDCVTIPYAVSVNVSGFLIGSGMVLQNNGGDDLAVGADGGFTFATSIPDGGAYNVTVFSPPTVPKQTCTVSNASGVINGAAVGNVAVFCFIPPAPLYPSNGVNWNDYVLDDGTDSFSASDDPATGACSGASSVACLHGGEMRVMPVVGKAGCAGISAEDALGAFDWLCRDNAGTITMVSTGLKKGKGLADLIDFAAADWKDNSITVYDGAAVHDSTNPKKWWANPIVVNNGGGSLSTPGTIYLVTSDPAAAYLFAADSTSLVIQPGLTMTGPQLNTDVVSAASVNFIWLEGTIDAYGDDIGVSWTTVNHSVMNGVTAGNALGYGPLSAESFATPRAPVPNSPTNLRGTAGDGEVSIRWSSIAGANYHNLYWSTTSPIIGDPGSENFVEAVTQPYLLTVPNDGTTYYFAVSAVTDGGESGLSQEAAARPQALTVGAPANVSVQPRVGKTYLSWENISGSTYNIYYDTQPGVTTASPLADTRTAATLTHSGLVNGATYYYAVTATPSGGPEGPLSAEVFATPQVPFPIVPTNVYAASGDQSNIISWYITQATIDNYNVYGSTVSPVEAIPGNLLGSPTARSFTHDTPPLTNGQTWYYTVTSENVVGISLPSAQAAATPRAPEDLSPEGMAAAAGNGRILVKWNNVSGQRGALLYWSTTPGINPATANVVELPAFSYNHTGLTNGVDTIYYAVSVKGPNDRGMKLAGTNRSRFINLDIYGSDGDGLYMTGGGNNSFDGLASVGNGGKGVYLTSVANTSFSFANLYLADNGDTGYYEFIGGGQKIFTNVVLYNNGGSGMHFWGSSNYVMVNVIAANNGGAGFSYYQGGGRAVINMTSVNNGGDGTGFQRGVNNTLANFSGVNNGGYGLASNSMGSNNNYMNLVLTENGAGGIRDGRYCCSASSYYTGLIKLGNNGADATADCVIDFLAGVPKGVTDTCTVDALSDATITQGETAAASFMGKVLFPGDAANGSELDGVAPWDDIIDWTGFENGMRTWGLDGALDYPDPGNRGRCLTGADCRIWDWSMAAADTTVLGVLALPGGDDVAVHVWSWNQTTCTNNGYNWDVEAGKCNTTFLRNAVEIMGDGIGNENNLCESGETCLYSPNIGAYQGHGNLISAGAFVDGTLTGITLLKHEFNGR